MKLSLVSALLICPLAFLSCAGVHSAPPEGFASYEMGLFEDSKRAVTPEGVTWQARMVDQKPKADLNFWQAALRKRMSEAGYRVVDSLQFQSAGKPGFAWEFSAPYGAVDYTYLVAVIPDDDKLNIVEASGPLADYAKYRKQVTAQLEKMLP